MQRGDDWVKSQRVTDNQGNTKWKAQGSGGGSAAGWRTDSGSGFVGQKGDDLYAGRNGNVYRKGESGWQAQGFVRTTGELPQTWALRVVRMSGGATTVERVPVDAQGRATVKLGVGERGVLAVSGTTRFTTETAAYSYSVRSQ